MIRPSAMPAKKECARFKSSGGRSFTLDGTLRHDALESMFNHPDGILQPEWIDQLDDESIEGIEWAFNFIKVKAPMINYPLEIEKQVEVLGDDFNMITKGRLDYQCGPVIFDAKWRRRNYLEQMACYGLAVIQLGHPKVEVYCLYMESKKAELHIFDEARCWEIINPILALEDQPDIEPTPCDYCNWCEFSLTCSALNARVKAVHEGRQDWELEQYHPSQITDPAEMNKAIHIARAVSTWAESVEFHAKRMALKEGIDFDDFYVQARKGNRYITSLDEAFSRVTMPQEEFLKCCEVKHARLVQWQQVTHGISKKAAQTKVDADLGDACLRQPTTYSIAKKRKQ